MSETIHVAYALDDNYTEFTILKEHGYKDNDIYHVYSYVYELLDKDL